MTSFFKKFFGGFGYAWRGIITGFRERNMKVHGLMAGVVVFLGIFFDLAVWEWIIILILFGVVMGAELLNTSIEELANVVKEKNKLDYEATAATRNLAAGAVLVMAIVAAIIGLLIFGQRFI